jgi:hypothetical protein
MALQISILTFLAVAGIGALIWFSVAAESGQQVIRQRMEAVQKVDPRGNAALGLQLVRDELMSGVPALNRRPE